MLENKDAYADGVETKLQRVFFDAFFQDLLNIAEEKPPVFNAKTSALIEAIRSGKIRYQGGEFFGTFNARTSRALAEFATFNRRTGSWKGDPPPSIKAEGVLAARKRDDINKKILSAIDGAEARVEEMIKTLSFAADLPLFEMEGAVQKSIGIVPEMTDRTRADLLKKYTNDQIRNIKNWTPEQVVRLRQMVERLQLEGTKTSLTEIILEEWGVSARKARFLARQETNLFFSEYSLSRARAAGIKRYRWSSSHDERVRESHKKLDGQIIALNDPPIVDYKTSRRAHAGEDFLCRCAKIWILEKPKENSVKRFIDRIRRFIYRP